MIGNKRFNKSKGADPLPLYAFVLLLMLMGVVFGVLLVNALTWEQKQDMVQYTGSLFRSIAHGEPAQGEASAQSFAATFADSLRWIVLVWLLGLSIIGVPLVLMLDFLKGVLIGFSVGYFVGEFAWRGAGFAMAAIIPHNLLFVPALIIASVSAVSYSTAAIRDRMSRQTLKGYLPARLARFSGVTVLMAAVSALAACMEAFVTPLLLEWISPWLVEKDGFVSAFSFFIIILKMFDFVQF